MPNKKKYSITAHSPATQIWYYEVEAESEEIAMHLVMSGEIDAIDYRVESCDDTLDDAEYEVTDVEDAEEDDNA